MDLDQDSKAVGPLTITRNGRRYFSAAHKRLVVERCLAPGASVAAVAMEYGFNANLVRRWVQLFQAGRAAAIARPQRLVPVSVVEVSSSGRSGRKPTKSSAAKSEANESPELGLIELQIGSVTVRLHGNVEAAALRTVLQALGHGR